MSSGTGWDEDVFDGLDRLDKKYCHTIQVTTCWLVVLFLLGVAMGFLIRGVIDHGP